MSDLTIESLIDTIHAVKSHRLVRGFVTSSADFQQLVRVCEPVPPPPPHEDWGPRTTEDRLMGIPIRVDDADVPHLEPGEVLLSLEPR